MLEIVRVFIDVPNMRNIFFFQISMDPLADPNQSVLIAA